eukprot:11097966-Prorocentrum_lima.AAC.1
MRADAGEAHNKDLSLKYVEIKGNQLALDMASAMEYLLKDNNHKTENTKTAVGLRALERLPGAVVKVMGKQYRPALKRKASESFAQEVVANIVQGFQELGKSDEHRNAKCAVLSMCLGKDGMNNQGHCTLARLLHVTPKDIQTARGMRMGGDLPALKAPPRALRSDKFPEE